MAEEAVVTPVTEQADAMPQATRRAFLARTGQTGLALLLAGLPQGWAGEVYASDAPETPNVRIGIIALTDCSSLVMAYELGLFKKYGIEATISKEASWAVIRDRLNLGENQASHLLLGIGYSSTMGLLGSPVKPVIIPCYLKPDGPAITPKKKILNERAQAPRNPQAPGRRCQAGRHTPDLCDDLPAWDARHVDALLAGIRRHSPRQRHHPHYHSTSPDGGQYEGGQDGRFLRR